MPMPRTPKAKATVSGQAAKNPQRFEPRTEPAASPIGLAPTWMTPAQSAVWSQFVREAPWLNSSHRALVEIAVTVRSRLIAGDDVGVQALNLLRQCLGMMGATPADASKVSVPDDAKEDPEARFFGPN